MLAFITATTAMAGFIYLCYRAADPKSPSALHKRELIFRMARGIFIVGLVFISLYSNIFAQEYLPPKIGGKKPTPEATLPANYDFSYDVQDNGISLDFGHNEKRKDDQATGAYHVLLPDGRMQLVEYEAGPDGYKPQVMYMGTATFPPASNGDKFDGYHYNAASNRQSVRQAAPRGGARQSPSPAPQPAPPPQPAPHNATQ